MSMNNECNTLFIEKSYLRNSFFAVFIASAFAIFVTYANWGFFTAFLSILALPYGFLIFTLIANVTTKVDSINLYIKFFPLQLTFRTIPLNSIINIEEISIPSITELRMKWFLESKLSLIKTKEYYINQRKGILIELKNGQRILIGSSKAKILFNTINSMIGQGRF